jgi:hypothetical protein
VAIFGSAVRDPGPSNGRVRGVLPVQDEHRGRVFGVGTSIQRPQARADSLVDELGQPDRLRAQCGPKNPGSIVADSYA